MAAPDQRLIRDLRGQAHVWSRRAHPPPVGQADRRAGADRYEARRLAHLLYSAALALERAAIAAPVELPDHAAEPPLVRA